MANRYPLVVDTTNGNKIREIPNGDNLQLTGNSVIGVVDVTASGTVSANEINATSIKKGGTELATVAVTGAFSDITGGPTQLSDLADDLNVLVPGDNVGTLTNNVGYLTTVAFADLTATPTTLAGYGITDAATLAQGGLASTAVQPGASVSVLTNDAGYLTLADIQNGAVTIDVNNTGDLVGSVFADDSTVLVDSILAAVNLDGTIRGHVRPNANQHNLWDLGTAAVRFKDAYFEGNIKTNATNVALGNSAGLTGQNAFAVAIGTSAGLTNQSTKSVAVGDSAGNITQGEYSVAVGNLAGQTTQGGYSVSVGYLAGATTQGTKAVAVGSAAGNTEQGEDATALGVSSANINQGTQATALGARAGYHYQGASAVAIGYNAAEGTVSSSTTYVSGGTGGAALVVDDTTGILPGFRVIGTGYTTQTVVSVDSGTTLTISADASETPSGTILFIGAQGIDAVAIGHSSGQSNQGIEAIAIGKEAGKTTQGADAIAIGKETGKTSQGLSAIAIGNEAGRNSQGMEAVAIGEFAGRNSQGTKAVAIGDAAGYATQGGSAVAIGERAGETTQGASAVAIGELAGRTNQAANSIVLNATGLELNNTQASSLVIKPVRSAVGTTILMYDASSGEVTHTASPVITGDITGSVFGDDSTVLVDGVNNKIVGAVETASLRTSETKIALGSSAGVTTQGIEAIAIGKEAGKTTQGDDAVAVGSEAGEIVQGIQAVAIGKQAGYNSQSADAVAVGYAAGNIYQGIEAIALGKTAGYDNQGDNAVAVGYGAGSFTQGDNGIALGNSAGYTGQGADAIAIGRNAGYSNQAANSIVINATGNMLNNTQADAFVVTPIRGGSGTTTLMYDASSGEITHTATPAQQTMIGSVQQISGPGAIDVTSYITEITTTGADDYTLADGVAGQIKIISMIVDGGDATITPTTLATGTTITMADVNDNITLLYGTNGWVNTANQGSIIA